MNSEESIQLKEATAALRIFRVFQREVSSILSSDFIPPLSSDIPAFRLMKRFGPVRHRIHEIEATRDDEQLKLKLVEYHIEGAIRFVDASDVASGTPADDVPPSMVVAEIKAVYASIYSFTKCSEEGLRAFGQYNAGWHAWPYWREHVASQCNKMDLPLVTLGMYRGGSAPDSPSDIQALIRSYGESLPVAQRKKAAKKRSTRSE